jgi:hypothetical protein
MSSMRARVWGGDFGRGTLTSMRGGWRRGFWARGCNEYEGEGLGRGSGTSERCAVRDNNYYPVDNYALR